MVADPRSKIMVEPCNLGLAETRFPKSRWGRVLEIVRNSVDFGTGLVMMCPNHEERDGGIGLEQSVSVYA